MAASTSHLCPFRKGECDSSENCKRLISLGSLENFFSCGKRGKNGQEIYTLIRDLEDDYFLGLFPLVLTAFLVLNTDIGCGGKGKKNKEKNEEISDLLKKCGNLFLNNVNLTKAKSFYKPGMEAICRFLPHIVQHYIDEKESSGQNAEHVLLRLILVILSWVFSPSVFNIHKDGGKILCRHAADYEKRFLANYVVPKPADMVV